MYPGAREALEEYHQREVVLTLLNLNETEFATTDYNETGTITVRSTQHNCLYFPQFTASSTALSPSTALSAG